MEKLNMEWIGRRKVVTIKQGKLGEKKIEEVTGCMIKFDEINDKFDMRMENFEF